MRHETPDWLDEFLEREEITKEEYEEWMKDKEDKKKFWESLWEWIRWHGVKSVAGTRGKSGRREGAESAETVFGEEFTSEREE